MKTLPKCRNYKKCKSLGFIYIYDNFYCGQCYKKFEDKMRQKAEDLLIEE